MRMLKPAADAMLADIRWHDGIQILDVASGTGEPGLTAAAMAQSGSVLATDLSEEMTAIARGFGSDTRPVELSRGGRQRG